MGSEKKKKPLVSNLYQNSYIRNWINDTERMSTSPLSDNNNISGNKF